MDKKSLLDDLKGTATIPIDSNLRPIADLSENELSSTLVEQLTNVSERILDEVKETNRLIYELFSSPSELKEESAETQALRKDPEDFSTKLIAGLVSELSLLFRDLKETFELIKGSSNDSDFDIPGGKGVLKKLWKGIKALGKGAVRIAPIASIISAAGMGLKDVYDLFSGTDGGANAKNIGGTLGSIAGAGIGLVLASLVGAGSGGAGFLASASIVGGSSAVGNMIGEGIGSIFDAGSKIPDQKGYIPGSSKPGSSTADKVLAGTPQVPGQYEGSSVRRAKTHSSPKVSAGSITSTNLTSPTLLKQTETPMLSDKGSYVETPTVEEINSPISLDPESIQRNEKVSMVSNDTMKQEEDVILPVIDLSGQDQNQQRIPNVSSAGSTNTLGISEVPDPTYFGSASSILSELYV